MHLDGPLYWDGLNLYRKLFIDGAEVFDRGRPITWEPEGDTPPIIRMQNGTEIVQQHYTGPQSPLDLRALRGDIRFRIVDQDEYDQLQEAMAKRSAVGVCFQSVAIDSWSIAAAAASQVTWNLRSRHAYELPGMTRITHAPQAWTRDAAGTKTTLTFVTGAPSAGEFTVAATNGDHFGTVTTDTTDTTGEAYLFVRYHPELLGFVRLAHEMPTANGLDITLSFREIVAGDRG